MDVDLYYTYYYIIIYRYIYVNMDPSPHDIPESTWLSESTYVNLLCGFIIYILLCNNI